MAIPVLKFTSLKFIQGSKLRTPSQNPDPKATVSNVAIISPISPISNVSTVATISNVSNGETIQGVSVNPTITSPDYGTKIGVRRSWDNQETAENIVATTIDLASIIFAYSLGVGQFGVTAAIGYAMFDAYIVIWQRKRFTNWIHQVITFMTR